MLGGGLFLRVIDYMIAWRKERREQHAEQIAHEEDRPRFAVDVTVKEGTHANIPAALVVIQSLGSLPLTIDDGEIFIESDQHPEQVQTKQIKGRQISPDVPVKEEFALPEKLVNPHGVGKPVVKVVSKFSYREDGKPREYYNEQKYIHPRKFEQVCERYQ